MRQQLLSRQWAWIVVTGLVALALAWVVAFPKGIIASSGPVGLEVTRLSQDADGDKTQGDFNLGHRFSVEIDGVIVGGIREVTGLEHEHEVVEYQDGDGLTTKFRPGRQKPGRITIEKDWSSTAEFFKWRKTVIDGKVDRKSVSIIFLNDAGEEASRFNLFECWPVRWKGPSLDAKNSGHATETLEIVFERIEMK